jgi:hypothetical protein
MRTQAGALNILIDNSWSLRHMNYNAVIERKERFIA